ncbi:methionine ABC transporter substrate-binding protein [Corynebacterium godavarianum]|uniref:Methionine ABC transporter substrate-binding protein n=3 Tax=Corynebacterium TaxID=1716 RepID=A0A269PCS7_9CORY|nr:MULTISPECIES: MetQ/NlpA family ABC transporter substrate-binding protein [Corynebacterium]MBL7285201.1 methionine ABC transporter substrate-binding protein [Corynebacterium godavarianum]MCG7253748.1 MetQ/NlpA family ABC transporter substrate-binding protein [Corynebacterium hadale]MCG7255754.1 MetQ/NlpA family ABC transporter substrate-binding protein [Corynebacterium hadale]MCG7264708.1 MetQ/NlpA family ABC transporter substrate-binding protein [Corynebacterium hadale]PAJ69461.1 methionine
MRTNRFLAAAAASVIAATSLVACGSESDSSNSSGDTTTVKIGTTDADLKAWSVFEEQAKEQGIKLDIVRFSEYPQVNPAHTEGQMDVSKFQTINYQAQYNATSDEDLRIVGSGEINVLGLFWKDHDSVDGIEGQEVAIPNDPSNQGRAINVLVQADLLKLKEGAPKLTPTPADIDEAASKVKVVAVDASQTPNAYHEGRPAIINNNWLQRASIDPASSVAADDPNSELAEPYINVFTVKADEVDNPTYEKLVEIWQSAEVTEALNEDSNGTAVQVQRSKEDLNKILDELVEEYK